mmetsp:Transcript_3346/g.7903  ORF Transcript_3346/g.7903 Transcript_3346/m.7903 type:complete len:213 (-) Transcript_3346:463-1101(-)
MLRRSGSSSGSSRGKLEFSTSSGGNVTAPSGVTGSSDAMLATKHSEARVGRAASDELLVSSGTASTAASASTPAARLLDLEGSSAAAPLARTGSTAGSLGTRLTSGRLKLMWGISTFSSSNVCLVQAWFKRPCSFSVRVSNAMWSPGDGSRVTFSVRLACMPVALSRSASHNGLVMLARPSKPRSTLLTARSLRIRAPASMCRNAVQESSSC